MDGVVKCLHYMDGRQVPCPVMCPYQCWPRRLFRQTWLTGRWKLRR